MKGRETKGHGRNQVHLDIHLIQGPSIPVITQKLNTEADPHSRSGNEEKSLLNTSVVNELIQNSEVPPLPNVI